MTNVVTLISAVGETSTVDSSFKAVKKALGNAMLEPVWLPDGSCLLVDEEGLLRGLPGNLKATMMAGQPIVGAVAWIPKRLLRKILG